MFPLASKYNKNYRLRFSPQSYMVISEYANNMIRKNVFRTKIRTIHAPTLHFTFDALYLYFDLIANTHIRDR